MKRPHSSLAFHIEEGIYTVSFVITVIYIICQIYYSLYITLSGGELIRDDSIQVLDNVLCVGTENSVWWYSESTIYICGY